MREQQVMPADRRARDATFSDYELHRRPTLVERPRTHMLRAARCAAAVWSLVVAAAFALAAVLLARSSDPVTALAPAAIAVSLGFCAREVWPSRVPGGSRVRGVRNREVSARHIDL